jgi:hypothetical protein
VLKTNTFLAATVWPLLVSNNAIAVTIGAWRVDGKGNFTSFSD